MFFTAIIYVLASQPNMYRQGKSAIKDFLEDNKLHEISLDLFTLNKFNFLNSELSEAHDSFIKDYLVDDTNRE